MKQNSRNETDLNLTKARTANTGLAKVAVQCSADTFVVNQSLVLRINICGENRHLRQAQNRWYQQEGKAKREGAYKILTFARASVRTTALRAGQKTRRDKYKILIFNGFGGQCSGLAGDPRKRKKIINGANYALLLIAD